MLDARPGGGTMWRWLLLGVCALGAAGLAERYASSSRFFPLFTVVRFANTHCEGDNNLNGTCFTKRECSTYGGTGSGTCGRGLGTCCVVQKSCGTSSQVNCTYFVNPGYAGYYTGGSRCTISISKCNSNVCQLRLDFLDFSLAQPDVNGNCVDDFLSVSGGATLVPRICGENTGEHVYVDFDPESSPIQLSIDANSAVAFNRRWNIKVTQIACNSPLQAPTGCLMYYTEITGKVMSFNFGTLPNPTTPPDGVIIGTREMVNLNYGVCVRMAPGYCSIEWSQDPNNRYSFTVSNDTDTQDPLVGTSITAESGANCIGDFVVIPNPSQNGIPLNTDRFCGNAFNTTTTSSKPFVLTVVTNGQEITGDPTVLPDIANRGFCLMYRQLPCPP